MTSSTKDLSRAVRWTEAEWLEVSAAADAEGVPVSEYVRGAALSRARRSMDAGEALETIARELKDAGRL